MRKLLLPAALLLYFTSIYILSISKANWYGGDYDLLFFPSFWLLNLSYLSLFILGVVKKTWKIPGNLNKKHFYILLFFLLFFLRLVYPLDQTKLNRDVFAYVNYANDILQGENPYTIFYPSYGYPSYGPVFFYISSIVALFGSSIQIFKIFFIITDFLTAVMLVECALKFEHKIQDAMMIGLLYSMNPLSIIETAWNPHNDIVMTFFVILALFALKSYREAAPSYRQAALPSILLGIGTGIKYVAGFSFPILLGEFLRNRKQLLISAGSFLSVILISFSYFLISSPSGILTHLATRAFTGGNPGNFFGFSMLIAVFINKLSNVDAIYDIALYHNIAVFALYAVYFSFAIHYLAEGKKVLRRWYIVIFAIFLTHSLLATFWILILLQLRWLYLFFTVPIMIISIVNIKKIDQNDFDFNEVDAIFISLLIPVFIIQCYAGWYWVWALPVIFIVRNIRIKISIVALILISHMFSYAL